ncbi:MAG: hypothetical protein F7C07_07100 [Desulfurococcales archaeon]|nr:hypothetical protein [Desulfurococcales archaeon]
MSTERSPGYLIGSRRSPPLDPSTNDPARLKIHATARPATRIPGPSLLETLRRHSPAEEDLEVVALAVAETRRQEPVHLASTDKALLQAASQLANRHKQNLQTLTPRQLAQQLK